MEGSAKFKFKIKLPIKAKRLGEFVYVADGKDEFLIRCSDRSRRYEVRSLYDKIRLPVIKYNKIGFVVKDFKYLIWYDENLLLATPRKVWNPRKHVDNKIIAGAVPYKDGRIVGDGGRGNNKKEYRLYYYSEDLTSHYLIFGVSYLTPIAFIGKAGNYIVIATYSGDIDVLSVEKTGANRYKGNPEGTKKNVGDPTARDIRRDMIVLGTKKENGSVFVCKANKMMPGDEVPIGKIVEDVAILDKGDVLEIYAKTKNGAYKIKMNPEKLVRRLEKPEEVDGFEGVKYICAYKGKLAKIYEDHIEYDGRTYEDRVLAYYCAEDGLYVLGKDDEGLYVRKVFGDTLEVDHNYYDEEEVEVSYKGEITIVSKEGLEVLNKLYKSLEDERVLKENFKDLLRLASALGLKAFEDYLENLEKKGYIRRVGEQEYEVLIPHNDVDLVERIVELKRMRIAELAKSEAYYIFNIIRGKIAESLRKVEAEIERSESINALNKRTEIYEEAKKVLLEELAALIKTYKDEKEDVIEKSKEVYSRLFDIK